MWRLLLQPTGYRCDDGAKRWGRYGCVLSSHKTATNMLLKRRRKINDMYMRYDKGTTYDINNFMSMMSCIKSNTHRFSRRGSFVLYINVWTSKGCGRLNNRHFLKTAVWYKSSYLVVPKGMENWGEKYTVEFEFFPPFKYLLSVKTLSGYVWSSWSITFVRPIRTYVHYIMMLLSASL